MAGAAEARLLGVGSSPGRMEEEDPMSPRAWSLSSSSTSSLASDVESDDGGAGYPLTQCEYEEIPSFRWIATPLRWWKTKKKSRTPSRTNHRVRTRNIRVAFLDDPPIFTAKDLLRARSEYLGTGAYGSLHKATLRDGHQLAIRRLSCATAENFEAEAHALGKIRHPNILALRAYCTWPQGQKALVFDYKPRGSLSAFLQFYSEPADAISTAERMKMVIGIARGLHHLHARCNIVHGNLTSRNILLDDDGDDGGGGGHGTVKIADYGLPQLVASVFGSDRTAAGGGGAPEYRAPELPMLEKPNMKTDVYSLGVIILELFTGSSPKKAKEDHRMPLWKASMKLRMGRMALASTWSLAWRCVDGSPDARPDALDVLRQLEDIAARSLGYRATGRDIGEETAGDAAKAGRSEVKSAGGATAGSSPTTTAAAGFDITSLDMAKEGASKDSQGNLEGGQISNPTPAQETTCGDHPGTEEILIMQTQHSGDAEADDHARHSKDGSASEYVAPDEVTNSPTSQLEGEDAITYELSGQDHQSAESKRRTDGLTDHMTSGSGEGIINPLSSIDWSKLENMEVQLLQVPSASPLISSEPDMIFQSYFLTLHKLGHTYPPLPSDALEGHVNRMVVGLHSMGYPLDAWTKAATLLLVSAKKREYIERYVEDYKAQLEVQAEEFTSAITLANEDLSALEQRNQELDETIAGFVAYLAGLQLEQEKVVNGLTRARDLLATAEAAAESISRVRQQQRSATSLLRDEMLQELPPLDEVFDSAFQEIMAKKF